MLQDKRILLIVGGGIAAYKCLDLIRRLRENGAGVRCILTKAGAEFVTPLSLAALSGEKVYGDLFSLTDEAEMGHIRLSREADLIVVAPATADLIAKMVHGHADDLATTALLATDKPVLIAPSMNVQMWNHPATQRNMQQLAADGIRHVGPGAGDLACGEEGDGRLAEVGDIVAAIADFFSDHPARLKGKRALVTAGPTQEELDPVRYITNRSSGKQGYAIAEELARMGASTILVTGPTALSPPAGVTTVPVETADEMWRACEGALPVDVAVCVAAVADWKPDSASIHKLKKRKAVPVSLDLVETVDILATLSRLNTNRPPLVIGFAAETDNVIEFARKKREDKGCDWIVANDVSPETGIMGGDDNIVHLITPSDERDLPPGTKQAVAAELVGLIAEHFETENEARA